MMKLDKMKPHAKQTSSVVRLTPDFGGQVAPSPPLATSAKAAGVQSVSTLITDLLVTGYWLLRRPRGLDVFETLGLKNL